MSIDLNDEILQDFLVEAGEILEQLSAQLIDLEQHPQDRDLLNTVFRGFHTVKGGAGFLGLTPLVDICHKAEDVFNLLRTGERVVNPGLMDVILRSVDTVNNMFADIQQGIDPTPAEAALLEQLASIQRGEVIESAEVAVADAETDDVADESLSDESPEPVSADTALVNDEPVAAVAPAEVIGGDDISEAEFEALLDALHGSGKGPGGGAAEPVAAAQVNAPASTPADSDDIDEAEFDALLDQLHGKGKAPGAAATQSPATKSKQTATSKSAAAPSAVPGDDISDAEFEHLLDELHGKGKGPAGKQAASQQPEPAKAAPAPVVAKTPAAKPKTEAAKSAAEKAEAAKSAVPAAASQAAAAANRDADDGERSSTLAKAETTVRVDTGRLDDIMNLVGELVLARNRLMTLRASFEDEKVVQAVANLDLVTADLQGAVMKTRMQPIKKVFGRFPRVVRDLARALNKQVDLRLVGEETDLDKNLVEALADPLVHLVRNSIDHGIESPQVREAAGKPATGTVTLAAEQAGDHILLTITDDGAGIDPEKLRKMAVKKGFMDTETAARMSEKECFELIFRPGASTKEEISDISGRGVGMDVVKTRISQLNGQIEIDSILGKGTTMSIKVPLTLAILPTLMVVLNKRKFALPLSAVNEIFELDKSKTNIVEGQTVVQVRGKAPPLFFLRQWLLKSHERDHNMPASVQVIMAQVGNRSYGFVVDQVIGQEEVVIKPLGAMLQGVPGLSGATITGDGNIALILDIPSLLRKHAGRR